MVMAVGGRNFSCQCHGGFASIQSNYLITLGPAQSTKGRYTNWRKISMVSLGSKW